VSLKNVLEEYVIMPPIIIKILSWVEYAMPAAILAGGRPPVQSAPVQLLTEISVPVKVVHALVVQLSV
jgi:hypothetical protein